MAIAGATKQGFFRWANAAYRSSMARRPMTTLCVVNGSLACVSDCLAQNLPSLLGEAKCHDEAERELMHGPTHKALERELAPEHPHHPAATRYDFVRTFRLAAYNAGVAPIVQTWFISLDRFFPLPTGASVNAATRAVAKRVLADQVIFAPIGLAAFFSVMAFFEGKDIKQRFEDAYVPALTANWKVWPLAQFVNFRFCPPAYRVPFLGTLGIFWTAYLSWLNAAAEREEAELAQVRAA